MWVLIIVVCGSSCNTTYLPGYYTDKTVCEEAVHVIKDGDRNWNAYRRDAYCVPAPDDIVYE
jgi:hypothetical protein